jgi:O-succinylbenzoic acid--CoA ligase
MPAALLWITLPPLIGSVDTMDSSQASVPPATARLVAVRLAGAAALAAFDDVWSTGAAVLPLDPHADPASAHADAVALGAAEIIDGATTSPLPGAAPVPVGTAVVVRTSGTTGAPRGVVLGHDALRASVAASLQRLECESGDRWLCVLPLQHMAGLLVVLRARALGAEPIIHPTFDVDAIAAETAATHVALVPTMLHRLLDRGVDLSQYRRILLGGAAATLGLLERARAAGARITTSYGMTETAGGCVYDGVPLDGVAAAVDPDGRLLLRGPVLADGYRNGQTLEPLTTDGWLRTNDVGRWDDDGRLVVTGRADDVIVTGGVNVSTTAVAAVLQDHAAVAEVVVIGADDPEWGQRLVAYIVPTDPAWPPTLEQLRAFVRTRSGPTHAPRDVVIVTTLPRTALGKIDRGALTDPHPPAR